MTKLTEAERAYDALKDGSAYTKPELPAEVASGEISALQCAARWLDQQRVVNAQPAIPPVTVGRIEPDPVAYPNEVYPLPGTEYTCGSVLIEFLDDGSAPTVYSFGRDCMSLVEAEQAMRQLQALLADPRVQAAQQGTAPETDPPPAAPAVRTARWYRDPNHGDDLTEEPCGPLNWIDYLCGEGDAEALVSIDVTTGRIGHVRLAGEAIESLDALHKAMPNMFTILADPRVKAAREAA
jgi:hypothetical protein